MRTRSGTIGVVGLALAGLVGWLLGTPHAGALQARRDAAPVAYVDGSVLARFGSIGAGERHAIEARAGASEVGPLGAGSYLLRVRLGRVPPALTALHGQAGVRYAEPDYVMELAATPNDPSFGQQWGLRNTGQVVNGTTGTPGADVDATAAWNVSIDSRPVVVAQVDSGVDYRHSDLAANVWTNPGGVGGCPAGTRGYSVVTNTCEPLDDFGHGTQVAGVLGAVGNNGAGIAGEAWLATILPIKFTDASGRGSVSRLIRALDWALTAKAAGVNVRVINDSAVFSGTGFSQALSDELDKLAANNILFVTAAGNNRNDNDVTPKYPCNYGKANEVCVAATEQHDRLAGFSNWGATTVDLAAPGQNIFTTSLGGGYGYTKGTSFAAPLVAGAAALTLSVQDMSSTALKTRILGGVDPLSSLVGKVRTGGRLDLCKTVPGC
jgi:subtilisin family serine protease